MAANADGSLRERAKHLECKWKRLEEAASREDCFFEKASATLERLRTFCKEGEEKLNLSTFVKLYTQAILDITYFEENKLVDEDFPEDSSLQKVEEIVGILSEPEDLVKEIASNGEEHTVLSAELLECLSWRKGALLYMYCHTIRQNDQKIAGKTDILKKCLIDGIGYLLKMLNVKCPVRLKDDVSYQDLNTARLLSQGVFSDTHLLAMMYAGEMCYWGLKHCEEEETKEHHCSNVESHSEEGDSLQNNTLDFREIGEKMLLKYVSVCEGPLKDQGWSTENAKQILDFMKTFGN